MGARPYYELQNELIGADSVGDIVEDLINKYAMGLTIYWDFWATATQVTRPSGAPTFAPAYQYVLTTKGKLIGSQHYLHYFLISTMYPTSEELAPHVMEGCEYLRTEKARQGGFLNGAPPAGPTQSLKDRPKEA